MSKAIGILALLWTGTGGSGGGSPGGVSGGVQTNNGSGRFAGQPGIYSALYNGGCEYQQAENCLKGIVVPYTAFTTASTSLGNGTITNLTAGQLTARVRGVTLQ
jgi:hypothetical protein